jgi:ubiquinone biosynthesis protein UbiJ
MTGIIKTLLGARRKEQAAEEIEALERATQVLQHRVMQMGKSQAA